MSKDRFQSVPPSARQWHDSFAHLPSDAVIERTLAGYHAREDALRQIVVDNLSPGFYQHVIEKSKSKLLEVDEVKQVVALESAALMLNYPQLLAATPSFPFLYRLLRMLELAQGFKRGGNTLFVASGTTIPEVLAHFIPPPTYSMVEKLFQADNPHALAHVGLDYIGKIRGKLDFAKPTQLLEGHATAIEPDPEVLEKMAGRNEEIGMPMEILTFIPLDIAKAIREGRIPSDLDTIIWHRAEPKIFFEQRKGKGTKLARRNIRTILGPLLANLSYSGQFMFTVGRGSDMWQLKDRVFLLTEVHSILPDLGLQSLYANRDFRLTDMDSLFGTSYGSFGCVASTSHL